MKSLNLILKKLFLIQKIMNLLIITPDRPDKSAVIGKGGWVVGKLRERLGVENIHVDAYTDIMVKQYRMELAGEKIHEITSKTPFNDSNALNNLMDMLFEKIENLSLFNFSDYLNITESEHHLENEKNKGHNAVVALSGGVDSSFSLIISAFLGFNPLAVTADPGSIVLPQHFKNNINNLCETLGVESGLCDL